MGLLFRSCVTERVRVQAICLGVLRDVTVLVAWPRDQDELRPLRRLNHRRAGSTPIRIVDVIPGLPLHQLSWTSAASIDSLHRRVSDLWLLLAGAIVGRPTAGTMRNAYTALRIGTCICPPGCDDATESTTRKPPKRAHQRSRKQRDQFQHRRAKSGVLSGECQCGRAYEEGKVRRSRHQGDPRRSIMRMTACG
jgi:hypothetical protein